MKTITRDHDGLPWWFDTDTGEVGPCFEEANPVQAIALRRKMEQARVTPPTGIGYWDSNVSAYVFKHQGDPF